MTLISPYRSMLFVSVLMLTSCVSSKKYDQLLNSKARTDRESLRLKQVEKDCEETNRELTATLSTLENTEGVVQDFKGRLADLQSEYDALQGNYDRSLDNYTNLQKVCADEKSELTALLTVKQTELDDKNNILKSLESTLYANEDELDERDQRIRELNARIIRERDRLDSLKFVISSALVGLSAQDLTVEQRDGKLYVTLSQDLLFEKNSKTLDNKGKQALATLAKVLVTSEELDITVEGHTDTDGSISLNWDLSVSRAIAVVQELTDSGLEGERITAAGRAFYDPVDPGDDESAKSKNRRTEIILTPRLKEILDLIKAEEEPTDN
jgi:chemotaxis protein MotB